ncbi:hypothetical protein V2G26_015906 [Clonostachys chloroleuca]
MGPKAQHLITSLISVRRCLILISTGQHGSGLTFFADFPSYLRQVSLIGWQARLTGMPWPLLCLRDRSWDHPENVLRLHHPRTHLPTAAGL